MDSHEIPLSAGASQSLCNYRKGTAFEHAAGLGAGLIRGTGTTFAFIAANTAGMALSGAIGQANPLVAALWGLFVWREFAGASPRARTLLAIMFLLYNAGIVLLAMSYGG
jgi:glucose uptake protein